jgi:hypothetical protein
MILTFTKSDPQEPIIIEATTTINDESVLPVQGINRRPKRIVRAEETNKTIISKSITIPSNGSTTSRFNISSY